MELGPNAATGPGMVSDSLTSLFTTRGSIDLNLLVVFDMLMREHSLTRAGKRLGLSQPATSHALARLRQMLEDDLFIRTPEGMQPTVRAEQMAEPVRGEPPIDDLLAVDAAYRRQADRDALPTVTPRRLTMSGKIGVARFTRFCTRTWAMFKSPNRARSSFANSASSRGHGVRRSRRRLIACRPTRVSHEGHRSSRRCDCLHHG